MITGELLEQAVVDAPDPELARVVMARLRERAPAEALLSRAEILAPAARLLGFSRAAADFFVAHPDELEALAEIRPRTLDELSREAADAVARWGPGPGLRRFRRRAGYRVAATDLGGAEVDAVMAQLTDIAEACLRTAAAELPPLLAGEGLTVIGMGKLGGRELNYASDVDVMFVHGASGSDGQERASAAAATLMALLSEPTADGVALRVDPDLRPEGRAGPLSRSMESMIEYYGRHAATWERQALLKARPVAGDLALGERLVDAVAPLVYPAVLPTSVIEDVRASKARIEQFVRALGKDSVELKRGRGGIRDVEFAVQLLQIVHGRRDHRLRQAGTLPALRALAEGGFVGHEDAEDLAASYRFLRRLEHRLQMVRDLQTHDLPRDPAALETLARSMGLSGGDRLLDAHARHADIVRGLHERMFYRPLLEAFAIPAGSAERPGTDRAATEELLAGLGFADPAGARKRLAGVVDPADRMGVVLAALFPVIAPTLAFGAWPDAALVRFERVTAGLRGRDDFADRLAGRPDVARRLAALAAASSAFVDVLVARPEAAAALFDLPPAERPLFPGDPVAELVRVAGAFATRELQVPALGRRLAAVAEGVVAQALWAADPPMPMAVIGLGRLGAEELSFASDLDLLFVYEGEGPEAFASAARAAGRVLDRVRATGWTADAGLRPEGRSGPLARSMASYLEYWQRYAETWEFQALLRARVVAGDEALGRRFVSNASDVSFPGGLTREQVVAIRRMRVRMEEERVRPPRARRFSFKLGYGSLADVQFAVELSLMRHGAEHAEVRRTGTLEALEALSATGLVEEGVARSLSEAFTFLTGVKATLELERRLPAASLPAAPEDQAALARRLGYQEGRPAFLHDYMRITWKARAAMERVFYGPDE